jgi:transcriptional regulator with XRE-family HTH domain
VTGADYRVILAALGLSQTGAAKLLGVEARSSRRWAHDARSLPQTAELILIALDHFEIEPAEAMARFDADRAASLLDRLLILLDYFDIPARQALDLSRSIRQTP